MQLAKKHFIEHILSAEDQDAISKAIRRVERRTTGEIKVVVREQRHFSEKRLSLEKWL